MVALLYFALQIRQYYADPFAFTVAYRYETEDVLTLSGYVVREEEVLEDLNGLYSLSRREGEKVGVGQSIATVYATEAAQQRAEEMKKLELQLQQLYFAQEAASSSDAALKLDADIMQALFVLHGDVTAGELDAMDASAETVRSLILKRDYTYTAGADYSDVIATVEGQLASLKAAAGADTSSMKAPRSGLYSAVTDGYETVLTPESIMTLTPSAYESISAGGTTSGTGKLIYGDTWYFVSSMDESEASVLDEGRTLTLRFAKGLATDTKVTVERISTAENGKVVVIFSCEKFLSNTTLLRLQTAEIILESFSGIRIPKTALRVGENGETGIYCRSGLFARYKPVEVVYTGTDYCLVKGGDPAANALATLREGDEVIVTAADLYDGKVVG
ncbi:MAG: hypothetical protein IKU12_00230 [Oscillospiraceae bacterium]|nr:hypothetical protein [Oscillospiraceae bacterium]